jgi:hypothetical protein
LAGEVVALLADPTDEEEGEGEGAFLWVFVLAHGEEDGFEVVEASEVEEIFVGVLSCGREVREVVKDGFEATEGGFGVIAFDGTSEAK